MPQPPLDLTPAYGRSYDTEERALAAWKEGKDWRIKEGPYCSLRDVQAIKDLGFSQVMLHWTSGAVRVDL